MEDGVDHHHCDSHRWGGIIPKHSLGIITVLSQSFSQVIQFFLFAKGEPQSWNNQEKATRRGKDWFLVSSKGFHSCWKLRKNFLPTVDIPQVAFTVGIALVGAVYVGIMMGINGNKSWRVGQLGFLAIVSLKTCSAAVLWFCTAHCKYTMCSVEIFAKQYYGGEARQVYCMHWELGTGSTKMNRKRRRLVSMDDSTQWSSVRRVLSEIAMSSSSTGTSCSSSVNIS